MASSPSSLSLTPLSSLRVSKHQIPATPFGPNTSIQHKPLLVYHSAFKTTTTTTTTPSTTTTTSSLSAAAIESHLRRVGVVRPQWRYTMFDTAHFHSTTHEVLCVFAGRARLCFGGDGDDDDVGVGVGVGDGAVVLEAQAGDVVVVPAGVAHCRLQDLSGGRFEMVGSYPPGFSWDMCYGRPGEEEQVKGIEMLSWFAKDPIYGEQGPVLDV